ncbi:MAG: 6-phosphogluconolactonase [Wenzhouxiangellaceae bacterium]
MAFTVSRWPPTTMAYFLPMTGMDLRVADTAHAAAVAAASQIAHLMRAAVAARGVCTLALSGGNTAVTMLQALASNVLPWHAVQLFQVDERIAARGEQERNFTLLETELISKVAIERDGVHAMPVEGPDLCGAVTDYARALKAVAGRPPVLDVVHLGLGVDGHTASLVPGDRVVADSRSDVAVTVRYQGFRRMTLTFPCLARARSRVWLITGPHKADALARLFQHDPRIPASRLALAGNTCFVDRSAATRLPDTLA